MRSEIYFTASKAGIWYSTVPTVNRAAAAYWIPAFAGMTTARGTPQRVTSFAARLRPLRPFVKNQKCAGGNQRKPQSVIPSERLLEIQDGEAGEHHQRDHFL